MTTEEMQLAQRASDAGQRVAAFLNDEAVKGAFVALEKKYVAEFKNSTAPAEREALHAKFSALQDLFTSMLGLVDSGKVAVHQLAQNARTQEARQRTGRSR